MDDGNIVLVGVSFYNAKSTPNFQLFVFDLTWIMHQKYAARVCISALKMFP